MTHDFQKEIKPPFPYQIKHNNNDNIKKKLLITRSNKHVDEKQNEWLNDIEAMKTNK